MSPHNSSLTVLINSTDAIVGGRMMPTITTETMAVQFLKRLTHMKIQTEMAADMTEARYSSPTSKATAAAKATEMPAPSKHG